MKNPKEGYVLSAFRYKGRVYAAQAKYFHPKAFDYLALSGKKSLGFLMGNSVGKSAGKINHTLATLDKR